MTGITDEKHLVEALEAICRALRTTGRDPQATELNIEAAEFHTAAVRTRGESKSDKPVKPAKGKE